MKFSLLLITLLISSISFGQKVPTRIGILYSNDLSFHNQLQSGLGISHSTDREYVSATLKLLNSNTPKLSFNRVQFDYRYYLVDRINRISPFLTAGAEFYRKKDRSTGITWLEPTTHDYCNPENPANYAQETTYEFYSKETSVSFGLGVGADLRIVDQLYFNTSLSGVFYTQNYGYTNIYEVTPVYVKTNNYSNEGLSSSITFGLSYTLKKRDGCSLYPSTTTEKF